jgi:hypothetical protein
MTQPLKKSYTSKCRNDKLKREASIEGCSARAREILAHPLYICYIHTCNYLRKTTLM